MSGRHEPPTNRSFYLSVATSTLRSVIIVALVVGGIVLLNQAFPEGGTSVLPNPSGGTTTGTPTPSGTTSRTPKPKPSPQVVGVKVGVFNGAGVTGLASDTALMLERKFGYDAVQVADAPAPVAQTTLYYRSPADKVEAQELARLAFKGLEVKIARLDATATNVETPVQVAVYLGNDYAALQK
jgi:hypothetical protein